MTKTWHRPTLWLAVVMAVGAVGCAVAMVLDGRVLQGSPLWAKPFKFAVSLAVYSATLSWMLSLPHRARRWTSGAATVIAVIMFVEVGLIALQAGRGMFTHYNSSDDPLNRFVQLTFGTAIPAMFLTNVVLALVLSFQRFARPDVRLAVRSGLWLAILGMASGYLMVGPHERVPAVDAGGREVELVGGHSVGVADGGPGLPLTGWSTTGGDLRVPHFFGMHGLQVMVLLVLGLAASGLAERVRTRVVAVAALGCTGLFALLVWQALRGEPLVHPGGTTWAALGGLVVVVAAGVGLALRSGRAVPPPARQPVPQR
ncbi:hypothetical protein FHX81_5883 [Saccharothrix saharensis]|uniref:Uncharacterized protein n=1 Tax=Saccharothrix saharensis TaxID=571190 RepID=A0A543JL33_9PSEU|nr:hypothetical protein [Saccharothrix saharensis]TQM83458.1 hypothetical protein FHX81_5883 [Saccharothrix saharensis]